MSLKGDLDVIASHIRKTKDPDLLERVKSLQNKIFQLIDQFSELEKEKESLQDLLKTYEEKAKKAKNPDQRSGHLMKKKPV